MLYYWQADFESGNKLDYFDVANGAILNGSYNGTKYYGVGNFPANLASYKNIVHVTELWMQSHFRYTDSLRNDPIVHFIHNGSIVASLTLVNPTRNWRITTGSFGSTIILHETPSEPLIAGNWGKIDIHLKLHNTLGIFTVKLDNVPILSFYGDTINAPALSEIDRLSFECFFTHGFSYDDILVADGEIRPAIFPSYF